MKKILITNKRLFSEWNYDKNQGADPYNFTLGSGKTVWWKCKKGHEWRASVNSRNQGRRCPYCSNKKVCKGNCLATKNTELAKEWHPTKNGKLTPYDVAFCSVKKVWWKCQLSHDYQTSVSHRNRGDGCPYCKSIILEDGAVCSSLTESYYYLCLIKKGMVNGKDFLHNKIYSDEFGTKRYDFYLIKEKKYIEVTGYNSNWPYWKEYLKNIRKKRSYVKKIGFKFEFVSLCLNQDQINLVRENMTNCNVELNIKDSQFRLEIARCLRALRKERGLMRASKSLNTSICFFRKTLMNSKVYRRYMVGHKAKRPTRYVYFDKKRNLWAAHIKNQTINKYLGRFTTKMEALVKVNRFLREKEIK